MQILLIEDNEQISDFIKKGLREAGHVVEHERDGKIGLSLALSHEYSVLVVDRMLPNLDGMSIVKALRAVGNTTPILFLTALGKVEDRVAGLKAGGDDYLVKPFAFSEFIARLETLNRRNQLSVESHDSVLFCADLEMNLLDRTVTRNGKAILLNAKEFTLLEVLLKSKGRVMTRTMLLEKVWGYYFDTRSNVIDVHISNIRKKIDEGFAFPLLSTIRGAGYKIEENTK